MRKVTITVVGVRMRERLDDRPYGQRRVQFAFAESAIELAPDGPPRTIDVPLGALARINPDVWMDDVTPYAVVAGGKEHVGDRCARFAA